jgi:hypothetical protein
MQRLPQGILFLCNEPAIMGFMKTFLLALSGLLISSLALADSCTQFGGTYQLADNPSELLLTVDQNDCISVSFTYDFLSNGETFEKTYVADGKRRKTEEDAQTIIYETAMMQEGELLNTVEQIDKATQKTLKAVSHFKFDDTGSLLAEVDYYNYAGQIYKSNTDNFKKK